MLPFSNKRKHNRQILHQTCKGGLINQNSYPSAPKLNLRPILTNISFGGMRLHFINSLNSITCDDLIKGRANLYIEFHLAPSMKELGVTARTKWSHKQKYHESTVTTLGVEYLLKTQDLYREIDYFFKSPTPQSILNRDRRFFPRVPLEINMDFKVEGIKILGFLTERKFNGKIINLSSTGMLIKTATPLQDKTLHWMSKNTSTLSTQFYLPELNQTFFIPARPVHISPKSNRFGSASTLIGLKFLGLSDHIQSQIQEYLLFKRNILLKEEVGVVDAEEQHPALVL